MGANKIVRQAPRRTEPYRTVAAAVIVAAALAQPAAAQTSAPPIVFATTTSLHDTGLLDSLLPAFEQRTGVRVRVVSVGSGQALELGRRGDADLVVAHAPSLEKPLADSGYFTARRLLMHNELLIVGPPGDPLRLAGSHDAVTALQRIAAAKAVFVSRGDRSGTHVKELELWRRAGVTPPAPGSWYREAGQAMGQTLLMTSEMRGYTLTDPGTFTVWRQRLELVPLVEGDTLLFNVYHVLLTDPRNAERVNAAGAAALAEWLLSPAVQERIGAFGRSRFGRSLFTPDVGKPDHW